METAIVIDYGTGYFSEEQFEFCANKQQRKRNRQTTQLKVVKCFWQGSHQQNELWNVLPWSPTEAGEFALCGIKLPIVKENLKPSRHFKVIETGCKAKSGRQPGKGGERKMAYAETGCLKWVQAGLSSWTNSSCVVTEKQAKQPTFIRWMNEIF